jgi:predicted nucleic acid-binding protein
LRYWDTSAVCKLHFREPDSSWYLSELITASEPAFTSQITEVELYATLLRKEREGGFSSGEAQMRFMRFQSFCRHGTVVLVPCSRQVFEESKRIADLAYGRPEPILIRSLDLIQIASASVAGAREIVTADHRMRALASVMNINVLAGTL